MSDKKVVEKINENMLAITHEKRLEYENHLIGMKEMIAFNDDPYYKTRDRFSEDEGPKSYTQMMGEKREKKAKEDHDTIFDLWHVALKFYDDHYPESFKGNFWKEDKIHCSAKRKVFENFTEDQYFEAIEIIEYAMAEEISGSVKIRDIYKRLLAKIYSLIPGYKYYDKLDKVEEELKVIKEKIVFEQDIINSERLIFKKRLKKKDMSNPGFIFED